MTAFGTLLGLMFVILIIIKKHNPTYTVLTTTLSSWLLIMFSFTRGIPSGMAWSSAAPSPLSLVFKNFDLSGLFSPHSYGFKNLRNFLDIIFSFST
ncbi:hypothetical protein OH491_26870 [Termitidicoccus mucosus]